MSLYDILEQIEGKGRLKVRRTFGMIDENGDFQEMDLGEIRNEEKESERDCYAD